MKKLLILLSLVVMMQPFSFAQNEQEKINEIKKNLDFIGATGTSSVSAQEASDNARELLALEVEQWLKQNVEGDFAGYVAKANKHVEEIKTQRGNLHRVFVYVCKSDILTLEKGQSVMLVNVENSSDTIAVDTTMVSVPLAPVAAPQVEQKQLVVIQPETQLYVPTEVEREILRITTLSGINQYLSQGARNGKVKGYGKYDQNTTLYSKAYLFIFDRNGDVKATLCKIGATFVNLATGKSDDVANYAHCGVIWCQIND